MPNNTLPWVFLTNTETQVTRFDEARILRCSWRLKPWSHLHSDEVWQHLTVVKWWQRNLLKSVLQQGMLRVFVMLIKPVTLSFVIVMHGFLFLRSLVLRVTMQFNHSWYATILLKKKLTIWQKTCDKNDIHRYTHRKAHFSGLSNYMQGDLNKSLLSSPSLQPAAE